MNNEEGKKIAIRVCSGVFDGAELIKDVLGIFNKRETLVGYSTIERVRDSQQVGDNNIISEKTNKIIPGEDDLII